MENIVTYDDTRDVAIRVLDKLVELGFVPDCTDTDDETEFNVQDLIHDEINAVLGIDDDENFEIEMK
jgi:hypothetical protein